MRVVGREVGVSHNFFFFFLFFFCLFFFAANGVRRGGDSSRMDEEQKGKFVHCDAGEDFLHKGEGLGGYVEG